MSINNVYNLKAPKGEIVSRNIFVRLIEQFKRALEEQAKMTGPNRAERKASKRKGRKNSIGNFIGNPTSPKAIKEYNLDREIAKKKK